MRTRCALEEITRKPSLLVIGLMSGTSADGMDAALVRIEGCGTDTRVVQLGFVSLPYTPEERDTILRLAGGESGGSRELALFSFWLGERSAKACLAVCEKAGIAPEQVDLVGSHGQTVFHIPQETEYLGETIRATLQVGEGSVIAEKLGCAVVSDFRVRDMAAGGQGAPLVPYAEYLLYRRERESVGLQNIGGIGNITVLPRGCLLEDVFAFDTGPGNMVMDQIVERMTGGKQHYDAGGCMAASGHVREDLLRFLCNDPYLYQAPPKTTGREMYGKAYVDALLCEAQRLHVAPVDLLATATRFTAECIGYSVEHYCPVQPDCLIVGGGGSLNPTLMRDIRSRLRIPVYVNEDLGFDSEAKEAIAFAILANECIRGQANNVPGVTGARHPVVMGKISL